MQTKELKRLSINKLSEYPVISLNEQMMLKGGWGDNGSSMYEAKYGEALPNGVGYNPSTDQCYPLESFYGSLGNNSGQNYVVRETCIMCDAVDKSSMGVFGASAAKLLHQFTHDKYIVRDTIYGSN